MKTYQANLLNSITLILAIGGGVLGLIIIGILIHYAVQKGKTKQKALKVNTKSNFWSY